MHSLINLSTRLIHHSISELVCFDAISILLRENSNSLSKFLISTLYTFLELPLPWASVSLARLTSPLHRTTFVISSLKFPRLRVLFQRTLGQVLHTSSVFLSLTFRCGFSQLAGRLVQWKTVALRRHSQYYPSMSSLNLVPTLLRLLSVHRSLSGRQMTV